jgi:hypothetical protein
MDPVILMKKQRPLSAFAGENRPLPYVERTTI